MTEITIAANDRRIQYTASGGQTVFPYDFPIFDDGEIAVYRTRSGATTLLTFSTDYTVSGAGAEAGGDVTLTAGATASDIITIVGAMPNARTTDFQEGGDFLAATINRELDRLQIQVQELRNRLDRTVRLEVFDDPQSFDALPVKSARASKYAAFDASGQLVPTAGTTSDLIATPFIETLLDDATAADARATLGVPAASESAAGIAELATQTETNTGTDDARIVTPLKLATYARWSDILPRSYIAGLTLSNNGSDATNDIDIAVGEAKDGTNAQDIVLASALTKRLDAAWAVGTNQGGLDTGAIANTTYHVWLIKRSDTGVVDALFSTSATSPTMPANYDYKRRIGSILRVSAAIVLFTQIGDEFLRKASILDVNAANPGTSAVNRALSVPLGIAVWAIINAQCTNAGSGVSAVLLLSEIDRTNEAASYTAAPLGNVGRSANVSGSAGINSTRMVMRTDTSGQIRSRVDASDANVTVLIATTGWIDRRGRDD